MPNLELTTPCLKIPMLSRQGSASSFSSPENLSLPSTESCSNACLHNILYSVIINACSLIPKLDELRVLCHVNKYDVICVVESWLSQEIHDSKFTIPG